MNNYHIYGEIGRSVSGSSSIVYKGRAKHTIEYVAIKSTDKTDKERTMYQVAILYALQHVNILKFINWYETSRHIWIIVEYCSGGTLLDILKQDNKLPEISIKIFTWQILNALQYIHAKAFIYADLKPSNILLNEFGNVKIKNFHLTKTIPNIQLDNTQHTQTKRGTPYYMAPELFYSNGIYSFASDIWAFGIIM